MKSLLIWPDQPLLSLLVLLVIAVPFLYAARAPMQDFIGRLTRALSNPLRLGSHWLARTADPPAGAQPRGAVRARRPRAQAQHRARVRARDHAGGARSAGVSGGPAQADGRDHAHRGRLQAQQRGSAAAARVGQGDRGARQDQSATATASSSASSPTSATRSTRSTRRWWPQYRRAYEERHDILKRCLPFWRSASQTLTQVERNITGLQDSAGKIDTNVAKLEGIFATRSDAAHALTSSASTQLFISGVVMLIAFGGAYVNFKLISLPMSAMVGGGDYVTREPARLRGGGAGDHPVRDADGPVPDGDPALHQPVPARQRDGEDAPPPDVGVAHDPAGAGRRGSRAGGDARSDHRRRRGLEADARRGRRGRRRGRRLGDEDPDGRADDPRVHAALRACVRGDPARVLHQLRPHRAGSCAGAAPARPRLRVCA